MFCFQESLRVKDVRQREDLGSYGIFPMLRMLTPCRETWWGQAEEVHFKEKSWKADCWKKEETEETKRSDPEKLEMEQVVQPNSVIKVCLVCIQPCADQWDRLHQRCVCNTSKLQCIQDPSCTCHVVKLEYNPPAFQRWKILWLHKKFCTHIIYLKQKEMCLRWHKSLRLPCLLCMNVLGKACIPVIHSISCPPTLWKRREADQEGRVQEMHPSLMAIGLLEVDS